jgi:hypothetical protein
MPHEELDLAASDLTPAGPAAPQRSSGGGGTGSDLGSSAAPHTYLQRAGFMALVSYAAWFSLIIGGVLAYEGRLHAAWTGASLTGAASKPCS